MNTVELIRKKRDKHTLAPAEIEYLISSYTAGTIPDYQFSALLMACFLNGMDKSETSSLTRAMLYSGEVVDLSAVPGVKVDKHSTGGVGDKTSLILAPIAAAAGVVVPMISGRGLGHTGGTLDKLESIPGFSTSLSLECFIDSLQKYNAGLIGQTSQIAPADKLIYALRDVTATVESIPLITASIMSKKLAEGIDGLVLDVKTGSGAFMRSIDDSRALAQSMIDTAVSFNKKVIAFITDMNQPLGHYIGNWLEVVEVVNVLKGEEVKDLLDCTLPLSGAMLVMAGKAESLEEGIYRSKELIANGQAFDKFLEIASNQGGDTSYLKDTSLYPVAPYIEEVTSQSEGYFSEIDTFRLGMAALELGAGRMTKEESIDPTAGIIFHRKIGDRVKKGDPIATIHTGRKEKIDEIKNVLLGITILAESQPEISPVIKEVISPL